jgi:raffinose/stachyose/melibiose transport system substrate-binding protein
VSSTAAQSAAPAGPVALTMWDIPESEPYTAWWQQYVDTWNAAHPEIQVNMEVFPSEEYRTKWPAAVTSGTLPDIWYGIPGPSTQQAWVDGKVQALDGLLATDRFSDAAIANCSFDGQVACMPLYLGAEFVYYNKALFDQAGVDVSTWADPRQPTWDEFTAAAEALKIAGVPPIALGNKDDWPGIQWMWAFESRFGGNEAFYDAVTGENGATYSSEPILKAVQYTQQLAASGWLTDGFNGIGGDAKYTLWTQGRGAMIFQGPWLLGYIQGTAPEDFAYDFFIFPSFPDEEPEFQGLVMAGIDALWVSSSSASPEAAAQFLNGFSEPATAADFAVKTQNFSVVKGITPPAGQEDDPLWQLAEVAASAPGYSPWWDASGLPAEVNAEMLAMSQGLFAQEITPEDFVARLDAAAGR